MSVKKLFMLKKVSFLLDEGTVCRLGDKIENLMENLAAHDLKVEKIRNFSDGEEMSGEYFEKEESKEACPMATAISGDRKNTLYITDRVEIYAALRERGQYVLPYYHERNRSASFPGALYVMEKLEETDCESLDMAYRRLAGLPWDILETSRLSVRETTVEDVEDFYRIYGESSITAYMEDLFQDRDEEIAYTKNYIETVYAFYGYGMWTVLEKESGTVVGRAGISWREGYELPELGFVIGVPWQGRGYAFEVCAAILTYAKEELHMERVQALVQPENEKSLRLCESLGCTVSGETAFDGVNHLFLVKVLKRE